MAPKDPVVEAWRNNPGAQVTAWDRKIAEETEKGEDQDKRFVKAFMVVGDCYTQNPFGGTWIRRYTYQAIDQYGEPFARGEFSAGEQVVVVQGGSVYAGGVWGPGKQNTDGTFTDYVGKTNKNADDVVEYQTFTATMLNPAGFAPGVPRPVMVYYPGYGAQYFGTWGHWLTNDGVRTNNYYHHPQSGRKICDDEPILHFQ